MKPRIEWLLNGGTSSPHERRYKGGGSNGPYYENLNQLYGEQAALGRVMRGVAEQDVIPAYRAGLQSAGEYGSIANQEYMAGRAGADVAGAYGGAITDLTNQIASTGTQLNDPINVRTFANLANSGVANQAAAMSGARERVIGKSDADKQWWTSLGMGTPSQASSMLGSAAGGYGNMIGLQNQEAQTNSQNIANAVQGGYNLYKMWTGKDGGLVSKRGIPRMASGGFFNMPKPPAPPTTAPAKPPPTAMGTASGAAQGARAGKGLGADMGAAVQGVGNMTGNASMQAFGAGMQNPSLGAYQAATQMVDTALPQMLGESASAYGTGLGTQQTAMLAMQDAGLSGALTPAAATAGEAAAAGIGAEASGALAGTAAAGAGEAAVGGSLLAGGAGATAAAAMPWVGAAVLGLDAITGGKVLGIFKDGGMVTPGSNGASGGEVDGPGGPQDDQVPALLSDGEFVLNAEAVQHFGLDRLNKMNQKGLELRKGLGRRQA